MPVDERLRAELLALLQAAEGQPKPAGAALAEAWFVERYGHRVACSEEDILELTDTLASIPVAEDGLQGVREQLLRDMQDEAG